MKQDIYSYSIYTKSVHLGIAVFGILAFLTGELAEGDNASLGYLLHAYLGLSLAAFMGMRLMGGLTRKNSLSLKEYYPFSKQQLLLALEDFKDLLRLKVPGCGLHEGLTGFTKAFGLIVFSFMTLTGTCLYLLTDTSASLFEAIEETHEVGESLIPFFLCLHVGTVVLQSLSGNPIWKKMLNFR